MTPVEEPVRQLPRLIVLGDLAEDVVVDHHLPADGIHHGTDNPSTIIRRRGGSAANTAVLAAALVPTRFIGRVGDDTVGAGLVDAMAASGVEMRVQIDAIRPSGTVVVLVDASGERTMFPDRGAAAHLAPIDPEWLTGDTTSGSILHVTAYGLFDDDDVIIAAIERARANGVTGLSIDVSAASLIVEYGPSRFWELLDRLRPTVLLANADEADVLGLDDHPIAEECLAVIKDGPRPARLRRGSTVPWTSVAAMGVAAVTDRPMDGSVANGGGTTGAGDAFAAGLLAALLKGDEPTAACRAGHEQAARFLAGR